LGKFRDFYIDRAAELIASRSPKVKPPAPEPKPASRDLCAEFEEYKRDPSRFRPRSRTSALPTVQAAQQTASD